MPVHHICEATHFLSFCTVPTLRIFLIGRIFIYLSILCVGCVLIGVDQHSCVYVMRTMNTRDPVTEVSPPYLVSIFEYLLTSGFDFWDLLTAVKSGTDD